MAIVRSRLGMQLPFKVNVRAPLLRGIGTVGTRPRYVHVRTVQYSTARRRRRAGAAASPYSTQTESKGKDRVRTR